MSEQDDDAGPIPVAGEATRARPITKGKWCATQLEGLLWVIAEAHPPKAWLSLDCATFAELLTREVVKMRAFYLRMTPSDVEAAVRELDLAGIIRVREVEGAPRWRLTKKARRSMTWPASPADRLPHETDRPARKSVRKRTGRPPWGDWKSWGWEEIGAVIERTVAAVKNGPALWAALDRHCDRVNAVIARLDAAYDRRVRRVEGTGRDPERRQEKLDRVFGRYYQTKRGIARKADRILIRMLKRATEAGEWRC